jgi:hypothetical protein
VKCRKCGHHMKRIAKGAAFICPPDSGGCGFVVDRTKKFGGYLVRGGENGPTR